MRKKLNKPVLAEGEVTGHAHVIDDPEVEVFENEDGTREFAIGETKKIKHDEHKEIELPAREGEYISDRVIEFNHFAEEAKRVQD